MKYLSEYRDPATIKAYIKAIKAMASRRWSIMEICGGQTHSIVKYGLGEALEGAVRLIHGPGCPVCVTPESKIDAAYALAQRPELILCSYGDMLRVPGTHGDLLQAKAAGADIRLIHTPLDALQLAQKHPERELVFFAVGFETTAPAHAMLVHRAAQLGVRNLSLLLSQVLVPPALRILLAEADCPVQGLLAAGHVCTVMGYAAYHELAETFQKPIVVTGFEAVDILEGLARCIQMLEHGSTRVENQYARSVREEGNRPAQAMLEEVFRIADTAWRGLGVLPMSGLRLQKRYQDFDAEWRFALTPAVPNKASPCLASEVLKGKLQPMQCPYFGKACTPEQPLGAPMVSSEGACMAYYQYQFSAAAQQGVPS